MKEVYVVADNIISPLGLSTSENFSNLLKGKSGIQEHSNDKLSGNVFFASLLNNEFDFLAKKQTIHTKFELLLIKSIETALVSTNVLLSDKKTILIISTTKGNVSLIENENIDPSLQKRIALYTSANMVAQHFSCSNKPIIISNACISGLAAILMGKRLIQSGMYDNAVVVGADEVSKFVLSGFESFQAISPLPCKPFDEERKGINLGEGAGSMVLSSNKKYAGNIKVAGGSISNDANHISGPSRTGEELCQAIKLAMQQAALCANDIDLVSAHGTATIYNDEMETLAFDLANLLPAPVISLKGYFGHTLGAAGIIESIISIHSLQQNVVLPSRGFTKLGVSKPLNVSNKLQNITLNNCIKTASGFGGCNAALIYSK